MERYKILFQSKDCFYIRVYNENDNNINENCYERFSPIEFECWKVQEDRKEVKNNKCKCKRKR